MSVSACITAGMEMRPLRRSRAVEAAGYAPGSRTLRILFRHGGLYDYFDVPPDVFAALLTSAHPWTEQGRHIKANYRCDRLN